jgi:polysaccharide pyruvyl transferase WcaK-like protein
MPIILMAGVVAPSGLGDELQYVVGVSLIAKYFGDAGIDLFIPSASLNTPHTIIPSRNIRVFQGFSEQTGVFGVLRRFLDGDTTKKMSQKLMSFEYHVERSKGLINKLKEMAFKKYYENVLVITYVRPAISRLLNGLKYDAGFIGGHTIEYSAFFDYLITYNCARTLVKGPLITYPISISSIGIKYRGQYLKALRKALQLFDVIFVRGRYSYNTFTKFVDSKRLLTALDSGFGIRFLVENTHNSITGRRDLTVCVVPRKDYFYIYHLNYMYPRYLLALKHSIEVLISEFNANVLLVPHTIGSATRLSDEYAVLDLLKVLDGSLKRDVRVITPHNILESVQIFSSCNVVVTSRMHAGIVSLAYGKPTVFFMPRDDIKVLDILSYLGLDEERYIVDCFNVKEYNKLIEIVKSILFNLSQETKTIESTVNKHLPDVEKPVILAKKLLS